MGLLLLGSYADAVIINHFVDIAFLSLLLFSTSSSSKPTVLDSPTI